MANTEGISDEDLSKLFSMDDSNNLGLPRGLRERQRMMDEFDTEGEFQPSAKVIRSSKRPVIKSSKNSSKVGGKAVTFTSDNAPVDSRGKGQVIGETGSSLPSIQEKNVPTRTPILAESIMERSVVPPKEPQAEPKKLSKFKLRQQQKNNATKDGFPSFDIPVGTFTRKGNTEKKPIQPFHKPSNVGNGGNITESQPSDADNLLTTMSTAEISESVAEIESILSAETIQFLRNRRRNKSDIDAANKSTMNDGAPETSVDKVDKIKIKNEGVSRPMSLEEKAKTAKLLANIQTEEELDVAFAAAMGGVTIEPENSENESELEAATKLLRSTAMRQRIMGAKNVCELLEVRLDNLLDDGNSSWNANMSDFPELLPVALRCILDSPSPQKHTQLLSYALRAISSMVIMFAHPNHRRDLRIISLHRHVDEIFQENFMHDTVPTTIASASYNKGLNSSMEKSALGEGCYSTDASADSAKSDAKAFYSDPAWTLLSRMRLIPCLANILTSHVHIRQAKDDNLVVSSEFVRAACTILSVLSVRSPGAAVAIAQHKDLIPSLISLTLEPSNCGEHGFVVNTSVAFPTIYLSCVIARQSRSAAKSLEAVLESIVYITATDATNKEEYRLQQWCLILWRTMLRYGLCLSLLSSLLPLSIPRLASDSNCDSSLSAEYLSAYSVICECAKIAAAHGGFQSAAKKNILSDSERETLAMSGMRLASLAQNCANACIKDISLESCLKMKAMSAKLRFLASYFDASSPSDMMGGAPASDNIAFVPVISLETIVAALHGLLDRNFSNVLQIVVSTDVCSQRGFTMENEAVACGFVETFYSILRIVAEKKMKILNSREEGKVSSSSDLAIDLLVVKVFTFTINMLKKDVATAKELPMSRLRWINRAHASLCKFLSFAFPSYLASTSDSIEATLPVLQSFVFTVIGRLQRGDEAVAAQIFSQDVLFTKIEGQNNNKALFLQDIMMREICTNPKAQAQLNHSFKLNGGPGLSANGIGYFGLESLRSETDFRQAPSKATDGNLQDTPDSLILPLAEDWLWKLLSSSTIDEAGADYDAQTTAVEIVNASLQFLLYVENIGMSFARRVHPGAKMYYLLNTCFHPESTIRNEIFESLFLQAFSSYQDQALQRGIPSAKSFVAACYQHSDHFKKFKADGADYDKVMELFFNEEAGQSNSMGLSTKDLKAVDDFVDDLCVAFTDFGAQYECFVHAIRFLLTPIMPVRVRTRVLDRIRDLLHLLTTQDEIDDQSGGRIAESLISFYLGGIPFMDESQRDSSSFLDNLASTLMKSTCSQRREGFFYYYAVGCLARSLASSCIRCECGVKAMRRRLKDMNKEIWKDISSTAICCMERKCKNAKDLASIVIEVCKDGSIAEEVSDFDFEMVLEKLIEVHGGST